MKKKAQPKQQFVTTTTLVVECPPDYAILEARYRLVRYVIPDQVRSRKNPTDFGRVYNTLRDQIDFPYKSFMHDQLDGPKYYRWAFYVLYPREEPVKEVSLPWFPNAPVTWREIRFGDLPFHVLLKLLQIRFFREEKSTRFVGQDKCYAYARQEGGLFYCVEMKLKEVAGYEFRVLPQTHFFGKVNLPCPPSRSLFGKHPVGNKFYFTHLRSDAIEKESIVYDEVRIPGKRAHLDYHNPLRPDEGRGQIVADFVQQFLANLKNIGIIGHTRKRTFTKFQASKQVRLPVQLLGTVGVYDNRLDRTYPLAEYIELLKQTSTEIWKNMCLSLQFVAVENPDQAPHGGVLVLLDAKADDFAAGGILAGQTDPYPPLYQKYPDVPKQSLSVNFQDSNALAGKSYLDYPLIDPHDKGVKRNFQVALNELYLKCAILRGADQFPLPFLPEGMAFVRRRKGKRTTQTTALWFENQKLRFADLGEPAGEETLAFYQRLESWKVDWDGQSERFIEERQRVDKDGSLKDLPTCDILVGRDLFVVFEDLGETVLYDYKEIYRRHQDQTTPYPLEQFRLDYAAIQRARPSLFSVEQLAQNGLLDGSQPARTIPEQSSLDLYQQVQKYNAFLEELARTHSTLTYRDLTGGENLEHIARIFKSKPDEDGKYHRNKINKLYQDIEMFLSEKGQDVLLYQGIWYDETNAFLVGSPTGMNMTGQANAHRIRRFQILQGAAHFEKEQVLATMGVLFVRHNQYTVLPYYFHLIDLYVENILRYSPFAGGHENITEE